MVGAVVLVLVVSVVGCGGDPPEKSANEAAASTTSGVGSTSTIEPAVAVSSSAPASATTYEVVAGDSIYGIASRFCVSAQSLAEANSWSDGVSHAIYPGDSLVVPSAGCVSNSITAPGTNTATTALPTSTTIGGQYVAVGPVWEPFLAPDRGDGFNTYPSQECTDAVEAIDEFQSTKMSPDLMLAALAALPDDAPGDVTAGVASFAAFREEFFDIAQALDEKYGIGGVGKLTEPDYLRMVTAIEGGALDGLNALSQYLNDVCPATYNP